ncbi:hypothetical protein [Phenylobacterium sp.]|jgi:hypothetical protein
MLNDCAFTVEKVWVNGDRGMFHCGLDQREHADKKMSVAYSFHQV